MMTDAIGPRGGKVRADVCCGTCVAFDTCCPAEISQPFGCGSWVDEYGNRYEIPVLEREAVAGGGEVREIETGCPVEDDADPQVETEVREVQREAAANRSVVQLDLFGGAGELSGKG